MNTVDTVLLVIIPITLLAYLWLFRVLPQERWQFLATLPWRKHQEGDWHGLNLTLYGLFTALATCISCATFLLLAASTGTYASIALGAMLVILAVCLPAAKLLATRIEKNPHGFTVGGASFVGILLAPWLLGACNLVAAHVGLAPIPIISLLAAMSIAYVLGEGIGRLGCLSFGCCYGKPVCESPAWMQYCCSLSDHRYFGKTRKIAFAGNMEGVRVVPVQAATCVMYTLLAAMGTSMFFHQQHAWALLVSLLGSQAWRLLSEQWRADFRGHHRYFSPYQWMTLASSLYVIVTVLLLPDETRVANVANGLTTLWQPVVILALQAITLAVFLYAGTSTITTSRIYFSLVPDWQQRDAGQSAARTDAAFSPACPTDAHWSHGAPRHGNGPARSVSAVPQNAGADHP